MRYLAVLLLAACASPQGNTCIQAGYFEGDRIKHAESGRIGLVKKRYGESSRCAVASHPILADVVYE